VSNSVVESQKKIAEIKISTLRSTRIAFLQLPFWTTLYLHTNGNVMYWIINVVITFLFAFGSIWLFRNIRIDQLEHQWINWLFDDTEWNAVINASDILNQIKDLKE